MIRTHALVCPWLVGLTALGGCATVDPRLDYEQAAGHVSAATGQETIYQPQSDEVVPALVEELLHDGITADEAVQVCLLNNPTLQAAFMDIGMARADVVQSGLLSNPSLGIALRLPSGGGLANLEAGLAQNIAELWQIPARKRTAERSLNRTILEIARQAAGLAADAKTAYYQAVGANERYRIAQDNLAVANSLLELALTRRKAGAANELDVNLSRSLALNAELAVEGARLAAADARRGLATLLGMKMDAEELVLVDPLPEAPPETPDPASLIELAGAWRLDIRAARQAVFAAEARLEEQYRLIFPVVEIGVGLEREERRRQGGRDFLADVARTSIAEGGLTAPGIQPRAERRQGRGRDLIIGPSLGVELPIFDQNRAQIAKARYALEQASRTLDALDRTVAQEVRGTVDRARTAWKLVRMYRNRLIPLAQSNLDLSREAYRAGRTSFLAVLESQRFFLDARSGYVAAAQTAATAIPELERTIGLPFPRLVSKIGTTTAPDTETEQNPKGVES